MSTAFFPSVANSTVKPRRWSMREATSWLTALSSTSRRRGAEFFAAGEGVISGSRCETRGAVVAEGADEIGGESGFADAAGVSTMAARREHDELRGSELRIGFDGAAERFGIGAGDLIVDDRDAKRIVGA